jgi:hypothetical protein
MCLLAVCRMDGELSRGQPEDEPSVAGVNMVEAEHTPQEIPVRRWIPAVDDDVSATDHVHTISTPSTITSTVEYGA